MCKKKKRSAIGASICFHTSDLKLADASAIFTEFCRSVLHRHLQHLPLALCSCTLRGPRLLADHVTFGATTLSQFKDPFKCGRRMQPGTRCIFRGPAFPINATSARPFLQNRGEARAANDAAGHLQPARPPQLIALGSGFSSSRGTQSLQTMMAGSSEGCSPGIKTQLRHSCKKCSSHLSALLKMCTFCTEDYCVKLLRYTFCHHNPEKLATSLLETRFHSVEWPRT